MNYLGSYAALAPNEIKFDPFAHNETKRKVV